LPHSYRTFVAALRLTWIKRLDAVPDSLAHLTRRMELATALLSSAILVGFALKIAADALAR